MSGLRSELSIVSIISGAIAAGYINEISPKLVIGTARLGLTIVVCGILYSHKYHAESIVVMASSKVTS